FKERNEMEAWLNKWISQYVLSNPASAGEETKAKYPLSAAEVTVEEVEGNPGYYSSKFYLRPHYQLEGLTVSLRLVSKLPSAKGGKCCSDWCEPRFISGERGASGEGRGACA